jgi:hypothetical protein
MGGPAGAKVPPKSGIKKKSAMKKKIVYWSPHKNKQTPVLPLHKTKTNPGPSLRKNGLNAPLPQKKTLKEKKKPKESKTGHLPPKKNRS